MKTIFPSTESYFSANLSFRLVKTCFFVGRKFFFPSFFLWFSTKEHIFAKGQLNLASGNFFLPFSQTQSTVASGSTFSIKWNIILRDYSCKWTTDFMTNGIFLSIFQRLLPVIFFCIVVTYFSRKLFILASGNGFRANNGFHKQKKKL